jgi:hypothetical protein
MRTPSALRCHWEDIVMKNHQSVTNRKNSRNVIYIIQLCKELERIVENKGFVNDDLETVRQLINYDPRAKLDINV